MTDSPPASWTQTSGHDTLAALSRLPQLGSVEWLIDSTNDSALHRTLTTTQHGEMLVATAAVTALRDVEVRAGLRIATTLTFGVGMFHGGVIQRTDETPGWASSATALSCFYAMDKANGSAAITVDPPSLAICEWVHEGGTAVTLLLAGSVADTPDVFVDGDFGLVTATHAIRMLAGETRSLTVRIAMSDSAAPLVHVDAVTLPNEQDAATHAIALWGSQVPSLGSLEVKGSTYPTVNMPRREYGSLHTFFDPDAWSVVASLSYSGVSELRAQARDIIERSLAHINPDGLVPHHFDGEEPQYRAISRSPQPGPNTFLIEAAIDHACATGDFAWLRSAWNRGLRAASAWLLQQVDPATGLLEVEGALWVDVFRRRGLTLDTNAMVVRTFARAAELAADIGDDLEGSLSAAAHSAREGLQVLWSVDHFVTSVDRETGVVDDHIDAENYLAIAVGATSPEQSLRILDVLDSSPMMHPGGRGTWVSLRRYNSEDCYLQNTGDSDIAMARLWWADLLARRNLGDRNRFVELYEAVRADLLELVWMSERYSASGHLTRAHGYHEYPGILDMMLREGLCGISLNVRTVEIAPMRDEPFEARFGDLHLQYSRDRVVLRVPGDATRNIPARGLIADRDYLCNGAKLTTDRHGVAVLDAVPSGGAVTIILTVV